MNNDTAEPQADTAQADTAQADTAQTDTAQADTEADLQEDLFAEKKLTYHIDVFDGPLDALLMLIEKHKLDIRNIEISVLLEQFLLYLRAMQEANIEIAGEFLAMAARLIMIKTGALLPKHEVEELKRELTGVLIEYSLCKTAAANMYKLYVGWDIFCRPASDVEVDATYEMHHNIRELQLILRDILSKDLRRETADAPQMSNIVAHSFVSVYTKIVYVLRQLHARDAPRIRVHKLYEGQKRSEQVAIFLALLELSKAGRDEFNDDASELWAVRV